MVETSRNAKVMLRRDFLALAAAQTFFPRTGKESFNPRDFGWIPGSKSTDLKTVHLYGFGKGKVSCLWKPWKKVTGKELTPRKQAYKDCVAVAAATCIDLLTAIQVSRGNGIFIKKAASDPIYSGGRNNIAKTTGSGGMRGKWAVEYLETYGNLLQQKYGEYDFSIYSEETCIELDQQKLPESLLSYAEQHPLLDSSSLFSWEEIRDSVAAGCPILFCSAMGLDNSLRDRQGFVIPSGVWWHAMVIAAVIDGRRPGGCFINSHGKRWAKGPKTHGQPDGSVWVDAKYIDRYAKKYEVYAFSSYKGFPMPKREYILW